MDSLFCPIMGCDVYDQIFGMGAPQPHIGTFKLKMGETFVKQKEKMDIQDKGLDHLISVLTEIF